MLIHYGVGPSNKGMAWHWYTPRTFLLDIELLYPVFETIGRALLGGALPALALVALVFATCRSAVGRALALTSLVAVLLYTFYGVQAPRIWEFFHWRASAVLALTAVVVGFSLAAPLLAASWLRLPWALRLLIYLPIVFAVFALVRNATGTDESLTLRDLAVAGGAGLRDRGRRRSSSRPGSSGPGSACTRSRDRAVRSGRGRGRRSRRSCCWRSRCRRCCSGSARSSGSFRSAPAPRRSSARAS